MKNLLYSFMLITTLILTGCADAGKNQTVDAGALVTLDASASTPSRGGKIKHYSWKQVSGKLITFSDKRAIKPTFTAPESTKKSTLVFKLTTVEIGGHPHRLPSHDFVKVTVRAKVGNADKVAPIITLNGSATLTLEQGTTYTEEGATATDNVDGTVEVTTSGEVDTQNIGTYTVTYTATDTAGNIATKNRTITVVLPADTEAPVIALNGDTNMSLIQGEVYTELGATATDNRDTNISVEINGTVDIAIAGTYFVTYTAHDNAGNEATPVTRTVIVTAPQNITPTAVISVDNTEIKVGDTVHFSSEESSDEDGQIVSYSWEDDVENVVSTENNFTHTFTQVGNFGIKLIVTDNDGAYGTTIVHINVTENNDTNSSGQIITGQITDINGTAISNATVTIGQKITTTDTNGTYSIDGIESTKRVGVAVTHPDYLANSRVIVVDTETVTLDMKLGAPKETLTFAATDGAIISHDNASVELPVGGYIDENGSLYNGDIIVKIAYYPITTRSGRAAFPGTFEGMDANTTFPIQSYGFMNVELTDMNGNPLNLDGNATATLTYPKDNTLYSPTVIPLWYYDEALGYWVEEGEATLQSNNTYVGTVKHFTSWNLDAKGPRATFKGCVEDEAGSKIANAQVQFRSINWDSYTQPTDENGTISVYNILANTNLTFSAYTISNGMLYYGEKSIYLSEGEDKIDNSCVVLTAQSNLPGTITVTGTLITLSWNGIEYIQTPLANTTVNIYDVSTPYPFTIVATGTTDANGLFSITFDTIDTLQYGVGTNYPEKTFILQTNKTDYDVGILGYDMIAT